MRCRIVRGPFRVDVTRVNWRRTRLTITHEVFGVGPGLHLHDAVHCAH